ncbi:hypothetical protein BH09PAT4_BH09PAT4_09180 [soil metagenome]
MLGGLSVRRSVGESSMPCALCGFMCVYCGLNPLQPHSLSGSVSGPLRAAAAEKCGLNLAGFALLSLGESSLKFRPIQVGYSLECGDLLSEIFEYDQI